MLCGYQEDFSPSDQTPALGHVWSRVDPVAGHTIHSSPINYTLNTETTSYKLFHQIKQITHPMLTALSSSTQVILTTSSG